MKRPFSTRASLALWKRRLAYRRRKLNFYATRSKRPKNQRATLQAKWERLVREAETKVSLRRRQLVVPMRVRALNVAKSLVGVMEEGGNNRGARVMEIIRANGGTGPEPWCGDFVAYCYRGAGSKAVQRLWAAVRYLGRLAGTRPIKAPKPGDIVIYNFDHTGLFLRWAGRGEFEAIEGNTGRSGAVSDSKTGGDGVYVKRRNTTQVDRWVRVER